MKIDLDSVMFGTVSVVCDDCLKVFDLRRGGRGTNAVYLVKCDCGRQAMQTYSSHIDVDDTKRKILASTFLTKYTWGGYPDDVKAAQLLVEHRTGVVLDLDDTALFLATTDHGKLGLESLERTAVRLMTMCQVFSGTKVDETMVVSA